jgi:hypothetical protein
MTWASQLERHRLWPEATPGNIPHLLVTELVGPRSCRSPCIGRDHRLEAQEGEL